MNVFKGILISKKMVTTVGICGMMNIRNAGYVCEREKNQLAEVLISFKFQNISGKLLNIKIFSFCNNMSFKVESLSDFK